MTREDVIKLFPEATDEQITNLLNQNNSEVAREKGKADKVKTDLKAEMDALKAKADSADELQAKMDEIEQGKMSELEKLSKDLEKANGVIADLQKQQALSKARASAAEKFKVTAEQAAQIVKDDGTFDYDLLGQIISEKETAAALAKEQEIAANSSNPGGGSTKNGEGDDKSSAVRLVEKHFGTKQTNTDIISQYANGGK